MPGITPPASATATATSPLIARAESTTTVVNTTSETDLLSIALPTDLGVGDRVYLRMPFDMLNNSGAGVTYAIKVILGATTVLDTSATSFSTSGQRRRGRLEVAVAIEAIGGSPAQRVWGGISSGAPSASSMPWTSTNTLVGDGTGTATEDLSSAKNLKVSVTMGTAALTADFRRLSYMLLRYDA